MGGARGGGAAPARRRLAVRSVASDRGVQGSVSPEEGTRLGVAGGSGSRGCWLVVMWFELLSLAMRMRVILGTRARARVGLRGGGIVVAWGALMGICFRSLGFSDLRVAAFANELQNVCSRVLLL